MRRALWRIGRLEGRSCPTPPPDAWKRRSSQPPLPSANLILKLKGGAQAPLANPLACGNAPTEALFTPYTGLAAALSSTAFTTAGCPAPLPFSLTQSTGDSSPDAGAYTSYTFNLSRGEGQQYLLAAEHGAAGGAARRDPLGAPLRRSAGRAGHLPREQPDRHGHRERRLGPGTLCLLRAGLPHRPLRRRSVRPVDRGAGKGRSV